MRLEHLLNVHTALLVYGSGSTVHLPKLRVACVYELLSLKITEFSFSY